ncbi:hypothetical protein BJ085DRAFT_393, partial [Dimargaris cristalligena]
IFALVLGAYEQSHSRISSGTLLLFYLATVTLNLIRLRTWYLLGFHHTQTAGFFATVAFIGTMALLFVVELVPKPRSEYLLPDEDMGHNSPEEEANIFSRIFFTWMSPMLALGYQRVLTPDDMWDLPRDTQTAHVSDKFQHYWQGEQRKQKPSLIRACAVAFGAPFALAAVFKAGQDILAFVQPQLLKRLLIFVQSYYSDNPQPVANGYFIALTMFATALFQTTLLHQYFQMCTMVGVRLRAALVTAIYQKALRLSNVARQQFTIGEIVNHMSVDAQRLSDMTTYLHVAWSGLFQIAMCLYFLYDTLGWSSFAGVAIMIVTIPMNGFIATRMRALQKKQMINKDARIKLMDEILNGIKVIKLYAWEGAFLNRVNHVRNDRELVTIRDYAKVFAVQNFALTCTPFLVSIATFGTYALFDGESRGPLRADLIFVALTLLNLLRFPLMMVPMIMTSLVEAGVAFDRIRKFLVSEELDPNAVERLDYVDRRGKNTPSGSSDLVTVRDGTFTWLSEDETPTLRDIQLTCAPGELVSVVGRVGSGKSSLISALLGDMHKLSGSVAIRGQVAYVSQQPWIMNTTLRENILFGHRYDADFYQKTIEVCSLQQDIDMLTSGDLTEIGEKGINLSGGQKARVSLARAVYARADVYLLDDPLSAVDAHVGRHIFNHVLGPQGLLKSRARILVTHAVQYLHKADRIVMLRDGQIREQGPYQDLIARQDGLFNLIKEFGDLAGSNGQDGSLTDVSSTPIPSSSNSPRVEQIGDCEESGKLNKYIPLPRRHQSLRRASIASVGEINRRKLQSHQERGQIMTVEESAKGSVEWSVYKAYAQACSWSSIALYLGTLVASKLLNVGSNLWLKHWSNVNEFTPPGEVDNGYYLGVYGSLGLASSIFSVIMSIVVWVFCAIRAARATHDTMLNRVLRSPMSFFDTTPLGRILNRFSKDQNTIDVVLPRSFTGYFNTLTNLIVVMMVIISSTPTFMALFVPLTVLYIIIQRYYLTTSRELKRLDSTT